MGNCQLSLALHPRVDLPDGSCTRVPEEEGGADRDVHHVAVEQDLDQSPEGPKENLASKGKPRIINPVFENFAIYLAMIAHLRFMSLFETLYA
jgi:hypothetical protein